MFYPLTISDFSYKGMAKVAKFTNELNCANEWHGKTIRALTAGCLTAGSILASTIASVETVAYTTLFLATWAINKIPELIGRWATGNHFFQMHSLVAINDFFYVRMEDSFANTLFSFKTPLCYMGKVMRVFEGIHYIPEPLALVILAASAVAFTCGLFVSSFDNVKHFYCRGEELDFFFQSTAGERINLTMHDRLNQPELLQWLLEADMFGNIHNGMQTETLYSNGVLAEHVAEAVNLLKGAYAEFVKEEDLRQLEDNFGYQQIALIAEVLEVFSYVNNSQVNFPPNPVRIKKIKDLVKLIKREQKRSRNIDFRDLMIKKALGHGSVPNFSSSGNENKKKIWDEITVLSTPLYKQYLVRAGAQSELARAYVYTEEEEVDFA